MCRNMQNVLAEYSIHQLSRIEKVPIILTVILSVILLNQDNSESSSSESLSNIRVMFCIPSVYKFILTNIMHNNFNLNMQIMHIAQYNSTL